jgi:exonuclease SbcD
VKGREDMRFIHLADLHLGKVVHGFSMLLDQEYILNQILDIAKSRSCECVLISGDVFDRTIAPVEALRLFDEFLVSLAGENLKVFIIGGNHDSIDRLAFASRLIGESGVYISPVYGGTVVPYTLSDEYGEIDIYLLPFIKPAHVRRHFPDEKIESWTDALDVVIKNMSINPKKRNILLCHQFITGGIRSESEEVNVGGADNVDVGVFEPFDYVALGHLHGPQSVGRETVRYCGSPLKYSFSEVNHEKCVTIVDLGKKGDISIEKTPLTPLRDMREIKGKYLEVTSKEFYKDLNLDDYYRITLTDEEDQPDALAKLRIIYPGLMRLEYDNRRTRAVSDFSESVDVSSFTPLQLFEKLYKEQNGSNLTQTQRSYLTKIIDEVWEETD